jgi:hypothetical protein
MSCEHAETTVLLYLFGEAPDGFEEHLAGCDECQESLAEHAATVRAVEPAFTAEELAVPGRAPRSRWLPWLAAAAAVAAFAMLMARGTPEQTPLLDGDAAADAVTPAEVERRVWTDPIELELDDMDLELDSLTRDLEEP